MLMGEALRLGGWVHGTPLIPGIWHRDDGEGPPRPRLPRAPAKPSAGPPAPLAPGAGLAAQLRRHRRRARRPVPALRHGYGRRRRPGDRGEVRPPAARTGRPSCSAGSTVTRRDAASLSRRAQPHPPEAVKYTKEICRYLVETYGRFPAHTDAFHLPGHLGAVLAPGDRILRPVRDARARAARRPKAAALGPLMGNEIGRMTGLTMLTPIRPAVGLGAAGRLLQRALLPGRAERDPAVRLHPLRPLGDRRRPAGREAALPYLFFESNFDGPWQHYIDAFAYVVPRIRLTWGRGPAFPARRRPSR